MPPALVLLALLAIGLPSALHAALGRPRFVLAATTASLVAAVVAQVVAERGGASLFVVGDAQLGAAALGSLLACGVVIVVEGPPRGRRYPQGTIE